MKRKPKHLTQRAILHHIRITLGLTANVVQGEYRINYRRHDARFKRIRSGTDVGTAYFTNDPKDALTTAETMARWHAIEGPIVETSQVSA